ncbi:hypothetical protein D9M73_72300 [compost metagenome]
MNHLAGIHFLLDLAVDEHAQVQIVRVGYLVVRHDPRANGAGSVEGLAQRHGGRAFLPVAHRDIVADQVTGNHRAGIGGRHMAAALADDHAKFSFVVQVVRHPGHVHRVERAVDTRHLLVEPDLAVRHLDTELARFRGMLGVVHADGEELAGVGHRRFEAHISQRIRHTLVGIHITGALHQGGTTGEQLKHGGGQAGVRSRQINDLVADDFADGKVPAARESYEFHELFKVG